ncbi:MAG TPA: MATE family efflux transporter [Phycisphaerales bacterium]|nr:MATE family efflux transporter [Phycisphaerales bacterium]
MENRELLKKAGPIISARLVQNLGMFIGSLMVAQLGKTALAASALATSVGLTCFTFAGSSLQILSPMISRHDSDAQDARFAVFNRGFWAATALGTACAILLSLSTLTLKWWPTTPEIQELLQDYFLYLSPGFLPMLWTGVLQQYLLGTKRAHFVFYYAVARLIVGTLISYLFIFGIPGVIPGYGFHGLAAGITAGSIVSCLALAVVVFRQPEFSQVRLTQVFRFDPTFIELFKKALPIGFQACLELAAFAAGVQLISPLGEAALGAHQIVFQYVMLSTMVPYGICAATALCVGEALGKQNREKALKFTHWGLIYSVAFTGFFSLIYVTMPDALAHLFLRSHYESAGKTLVVLRDYFKIIAVYQVLDGIRLNYIGALRGALHTREALKTSILAFWVIGLPLAAFLIHSQGRGALALPFSLTVGMLVGTVSIYGYYKKGNEKSD